MQLFLRKAARPINPISLLKKITQNTELLYSLDKIITKISIENCYYYGIGISEELSLTSVCETAIRKLIINYYSKCSPINFQIVKIIQYALYKLFDFWKIQAIINMKIDENMQKNPPRNISDGLPDSLIKDDMMYKVKRAMPPRVVLVPNWISKDYKLLYKNFTRKLRSARKKFYATRNRLERLDRNNRDQKRPNN